MQTAVTGNSPVFRKLPVSRFSKFLSLELKQNLEQELLNLLNISTQSGYRKFKYFQDNGYFGENCELKQSNGTSNCQSVVSCTAQDAHFRSRDYLFCFHNGIFSISRKLNIKKYLFLILKI